jgi:glycosyltransferase involved in cell wall biosynthesis
VRVLHVIPAVAARYGGPSAAIGPMCRALNRCGVDPLIVTTDADGPGRLTVQTEALTSYEGVPAFFFRKDFSESFKYSSGLVRWLSGHLAEFDVVHIHAVLSHVCLAAAAQCRRARVPYVLRPLGTLAPWSLGQHALRKRIAITLGGRRAVLQAAAIHCTSDEEQRGIEHAFPQARTAVIPLGIDDEYLIAKEVDWSERDRDPYVLVVSRLHAKKNLEALAKAFIDAASTQSQPWRLVIAGDGEPAYVASLKEFVREIDDGGRIAFVGWVEKQRKRNLIQHASLFALPSLHENFGVSLLEALAAGVPALVSRQVDLADAIERGGAGWICDTSVESLRTTLEAAMTSRTERMSRGRLARELANRFSWSDIAARLVDLYHDIRAPYAPMASPVLSADAARR